MEKKRCPWAKTELDIAYHDEEWGRPLHDDRKLFEMLILEGMQAGLSWELILRKRGAFREALAGFDPAAVAEFSDKVLGELLLNPGIVRNRAKLFAARGNARAFLEAQAKHGSFDRFFWEFSGGGVITNRWETPEEVPAVTPLSEAMSRELKRLGFRFVGPTICYSLMQAVGMVNDHMVWCDFYGAPPR